MKSPENKCADQLAAILHKQAGPYLFIGAGMSIRYAGLPGWKDLLKEFTQYTDYPIEYYSGEANGDLSKAASSIANNFYEEWWRRDEFKESRKISSNSITKKSSPLKVEISNYLRRTLSAHTVPDNLRLEYEAFSRVEIDAIITTNFDSLLSELFPTFRIFVGQDELLFENPQGVAEIYHIHGSTNNPDSLILTDEDYADFNKRNPYLAAKLITIFTEHPVIFLGYSMSDENIMQILQAVVQGFRPENAERLRKKIIFVDWKPDSQPEIHESEISIDGTMIPITRIVTENYQWIYDTLAIRNRALPAWLLRNLKEQVYDLVNSDDPKRRLMYVKDISDAANDPTSNTADIDVVFGVGARILKKGLIGLSRWDLVDDILDDPSLQLDPTDILKIVLPRFPIATYVPIFKYLHAADLLDDPQSTDFSDIPEKVVTRFTTYSSHFTSLSMNTSLLSISELYKANEPRWIADNSWNLPQYTNDTEGLRTFLIEHRSWKDNSYLGVQYAKLAVVYDWMRFGRS